MSEFKCKKCSSGLRNLNTIGIYYCFDCDKEVHFKYRERVFKYYTVSPSGVLRDLGVFPMTSGDAEAFNLILEERERSKKRAIKITDPQYL